jgi:ABC-2 type transport system ATP-binding protein
MPEPFLDVHDVSKRYGATVALDGVRCQVHDGEMFGLLGPNGAGKTTLLSIISCLTAAGGGEVRLLGQLLTPHNRRVRNLIGVVPQELAIYNDLSARENLLFFGQLYGLGGEFLRRRVADLLRAVGLEDRADQRAGTFSGGMKRRLNLAAGLVHSPRLLLLDEPTTGVDPQSRNLVFEEVRRVNAEGMTVVYTSHYMEEVQSLCPRIGIMDRGRVIACDTLPNLLALRQGVIRFRLSSVPPGMRERLDELPNCPWQIRGGGEVAEGIQVAPEFLGGPTPPARHAVAEVGALTTVQISCRDVKHTLLRLGPILLEAGVEALDLETEEPNLESVFLHLTGKALRD